MFSHADNLYYAFYSQNWPAQCFRKQKVRKIGLLTSFLKTYIWFRDTDGITHLMYILHRSRCPTSRPRQKKVLMYVHNKTVWTSLTGVDKNPFLLLKPFDLLHQLQSSVLKTSNRVSARFRTPLLHIFLTFSDYFKLFSWDVFLHQL